MCLLVLVCPKRTFSPITWISPLSAFRRPRIAFIVVVFPAPFFPIKPKMLCSGTDRSSPQSTSLLPKFFFRFCIVSTSMSVLLLAKQEVQDRADKLHADHCNNKPQSTIASFIIFMCQDVIKRIAQQGKLSDCQRD